MMVMNYAPTIADMKAMRDGERLVEFPRPYGPYYTLMSTGETWQSLTDGLPVWEKGGDWWREKGTGNVLSALELRTTRKYLYPMLSDDLIEKYLTETEYDA